MSEKIVKIVLLNEPPGWCPNCGLDLRRVWNNAEALNEFFGGHSWTCQNHTPYGVCLMGFQFVPRWKLLEHAAVNGDGPQHWESKEGVKP